MKAVVVAVVLATLGLTAMMVENELGSGVRFTRPDGSAVYVNPRAIASVSAHGTGSIILFSSGGKQAVTESVEEVIEAIQLDRPGGEDDGP